MSNPKSIAAKAMPTKPDMTKEERRKAMPYTSEFIDWFRAEFGDPVEIRASENGHEIDWRRK